MRVLRVLRPNDWTARLLALTLAILVCACGSQDSSPRPNIVLIAVDTLRADRLPFYGGPPDAAPFLNELSQRSLVFEQAWSPSSWTLPSAVSVFTSVHPFQHGVNNLIGLELGPEEEPVPVSIIPEEIETLAELLSSEGYRTFGVVSNILVGEAIGFERGFDRFVQLPDEDADQVNAVVEEWREEILGEEPFFLYLHYFDTHDPFHAREPWFDLARTEAGSGWPEIPSLEGAGVADDLGWLMESQLRPGPEGFEGRSSSELSPAELEEVLTWIKAAYDSEIGFVDSRIRAVYEMLGLDESVVIFFADHGEEFYEHGDLTHGFNLYGETVRVPLMLYLPPGDAVAVGRLASSVSTLDIVPTLRRLLELPSSAVDQGYDLLSESPRPPVLGILEGDSGQHSLGDDLRSIVSDGFRLIVRDNGQVELFDLGRDPLERHDLSEQHSERVAELLRELSHLERSAPAYPPAKRLPPPPSEELLEHLKGLGYLGSDG